MAFDVFASPPPGTIICGGSWAKMSLEARMEVWQMHDYLVTGGKKVHGSFEQFRAEASLRGKNADG